MGEIKQHDGMVHCVFNVNHDIPRKTKHICWTTRDEADNEISLIEIIEVSYPHPEAEDFATISVLETVYHGKYKRHEIGASPLILMEAVENNITFTRRG